MREKRSAVASETGTSVTKGLARNASRSRRLLANVVPLRNPYSNSPATTVANSTSSLRRTSAATPS